MDRSVEIELVPEDLTEASKLQFKRSLRRPRALVAIPLLALIATAMFAVLVWNGGDSLPAIVVFAVASPLSLLAGPFLVIFFLTPITSKRIFAQQASLRQPYTMTWDEKTYSTFSERGRATIAWTDFFRIERNDRLIVLYESQALRRIVPLRYLNAEQRADIERIIATHTSQS